jgi:hypothetical protein
VGILIETRRAESFGREWLRRKRKYVVKLKFGEGKNLIILTLDGGKMNPVLQPVTFAGALGQILPWSWAAVDANGVPVTGTSVVSDTPGVVAVVVLTTNPDGTPLTGQLVSVANGTANVLFSDTNGDIPIQVQCTVDAPAPAPEVPVTLGTLQPPNPVTPAVKKA